MIDYRLTTFLTLCTELNYTETGKKLHITQPNVSQHIKYLEEYYGVKLFYYSNRKLQLTREGQELQELIIRLKADSRKIKSHISELNPEKERINFGATLTIGEYIMPDIIRELDLDKFNISMKVENTKNLLNKLNNSLIDFAIIEGNFDKSKYDTFLFSREKFVAIGSNKFEGEYSLEDLLEEKLILREKGSGTREVLEHLLFDKNLNILSFQDIVEIGNMNAIQKLVCDDIGISFLYEKACLKFIEEKLIKKINIKDLNIYREFNFVILKDSKYRDKYFKIYEKLKNIYENSQKNS